MKEFDHQASASDVRKEAVPETTADARADLLLCPFCGSTGRHLDQVRAVQCDGCGALGPYAWGAVEAEDLWNKRV